MKTTTLMLMLATVLVIAFFAGAVSLRASFQTRVTDGGGDFLEDKDNKIHVIEVEGSRYVVVTTFRGVVMTPAVPAP